LPYHWCGHRLLEGQRAAATNAAAGAADIALGPAHAGEEWNAGHILVLDSGRLTLPSWRTMVTKNKICCFLTVYRVKKNDGKIHKL